MSLPCDEGEPCEVYNESLRKAKKEHRCQACKETIGVGDIYNRTFLVFDGEPEAIARCLRCQTIHEHLRTLAPGDMYPAERLDCGEEYKRHWGVEPPDEIAALAFALPHELQAVAHREKGKW